MLSPKDMRPLRYVQICLPVLILAVAFTSFLGCGDDGPKRYDLSGSVTFGDDPIPAGTIVFEPDSSKGNSGPQGVAQIVDGKFDTSDGDKGPIGGPHIVRITGFASLPESENDPVQPLFQEYNIEIDLPTESGPMDFKVPADAPQARTYEGGEI